MPQVHQSIREALTRAPFGVLVVQRVPSTEPNTADDLVCVYSTQTAQRLLAPPALPQNCSLGTALRPDVAIPLLPLLRHAFSVEQTKEHTVHVVTDGERRSLRVSAALTEREPSSSRFVTTPRSFTPKPNSGERGAPSGHA